ncbi:MAG: serine/threonine protein kinase [Paraglaciecola psychrophila]|jgi:serine/threonine protein kinase
MTKRATGNNEGNDATVVSTSKDKTPDALTAKDNAETVLLPITPNQDNDRTVISSAPATSQTNSVEDNDATVVSTSKNKTPDALTAKDNAETVLLPITPNQDNDRTVISSAPAKSQTNSVEDNDATVVSSTNTKAPVQNVDSQSIAVDATVLYTAPLPASDRTVIASPQQSKTRLGSKLPAATDTYTGTGTGTYTETKNPLTNTFHKPFAVGGEAIKDRFIIKKVLGEGGMGMVCQALDLRRVEADDEEPYIAIKLLSGAFQQHASAFKSLQRETKKTQALAHPNIITVYDFDRDGDTIFMTMEQLDGHPLDAIINGSTDVKLNPKSALKIVREIALALEYAHSKGIVHSDLKPGNIFYTKTGQTKVLDFGIARALNSGLYKDNFDAGDLNSLTPKYASLEMFGYGEPDTRDDIYALGLIAGELLAGGHPYRGKTAIDVRDGELKVQLNKTLGALYKRAITKAVALNRDDRTQSASQFLSSLSWAEKGAKRALFAATLVISLAVGNVFLIESVDNAVPLSELPAADQQSVMENIAEADTALRFQDYNGALIYLDRVYLLHPSNEDVEDRSQQIIAVLQQQLENNDGDADYRQFMLKQVVEVGKYDFMARNEQYQVLQKRLQ